MSTELPCGRKRPQSPTHLWNWQLLLNEFLKSKGLRNTPQRENVAKIALTHKSHFEIQHLITKVQSQYPEISPATVYRTVATLCEAGLLKETFQSHLGVKLYEVNDNDHHDHVICSDCGEIFEFDDEKLETAQTQALKKLNFEQVSHQHVIYARCAFLKK